MVSIRKRGRLEMVNPWKVDLPVLFSHCALKRAWQEVRKKGPTAGVDGITLDQFSSQIRFQLDRLHYDLVEGTYKPLPVRTILVRKAGGRRRTLGVWSIRDRVAQRVVHDFIDPLIDPYLAPCNFGFRRGVNRMDAIDMVKKTRSMSFSWCLHGDIDHCFDTIRSERLLPILRQRVHHEWLNELIEAWLYTPLEKPFDNGSVVAGVSQGSVISPLLSNIYLDVFDRAMLSRGVHIVRYVDDFVVMCRSEREVHHRQKQVAAELSNLGLQLGRDKTFLVREGQGFTFLGEEV
jgi:group II intron reverse transcriptase/maturase